nr:androgen-induced gene 1 protein-like [Leptinotarsa decemlineata]
MGVREIFHFVAAVHFWGGCYYDWNYVKIPAHVHNMGESFGFSGKLKFLTYWNALLQATFFTVCLLNDFIGTNENIPKRIPLIRKVKDTLMTSLALPLSLFVALTFWGIYCIDRELILPKAIAPYFPDWLNHLMHTNIAIFILIELFISFRKYPTRKQGLRVLCIFMLIYLVWVHVINYYTGFWVYPILTVLNVPSRIVFFAVLLIFIVLLYIAGETLNNLVWRKQLKALKMS